MAYINIGQLLWVALVAGVIGTAGMTFFLQSITKSGIANADMVRAIGSLFTKSLDNAFGIGIAIHFFFGYLFAVLYILLITFFNIHSFLATTGFGLLLGFIHGAVVGFTLVAAVAESHPLEQFRDPGFSVAVAHWAAHVIFGILVGALISLMGY